MISNERTGQPQGATINLVISCTVSLNVLSTLRSLRGWEVQLEKNQQEF